MELENLFKWTGEVKVVGADGEPVMYRNKPLVLYQRVVGDSEIAEARHHALQRSKRLRKDLREDDSLMRDSVIPEYDDLKDDDLKSAIVLSESMILRQKAINTVAEPVEPVLLSDASLEEQEEHDTAISEANAKWEAEVNKRTKELMDARLKELQDMDRDALIDLFLSTTINAVCRSQMLRTFNEWCTYLGTYKDRAFTKRAFKNFESFNNASTILKNQLVSSYLTLEISGDTLKN